MAEPSIRQPDLLVAEGDPGAQLVLHCEADDAPAIAALAGISLPSEMLRSAATGAWRALHLAPDEWLLIGPVAERDAVAARIGTAAQPQSLVDVSERNRHVRIAGRAAATLLRSACPLDLDARAFPASGCTRTVFGKAAVLLERDADCFRMHYARSFRDYVLGLVRMAALDLPESRSNQGEEGGMATAAADGAW